MIRRQRLVPPVVGAVSAFLLLGMGSVGALAGSDGAQASHTPRHLAASECPPLPPASDFTTVIDNPYFPLEPGTTYVYAEMSEGKRQKDTVVVTDDTQVVQGVRTRVVTDVVTAADGSAVEKTRDLYAQDKDGNVWYFGEATAEFHPFDTTGSWLSGRHGARPGIIMEAHSQVGDQYFQECAPADEAQDEAVVVDVDASVKVPFGEFDQALVTEERSQFSTNIDKKYYAPCVGFVRSTLVVGGPETVVLISVTDSTGQAVQASPTCDAVSTAPGH